MSVAAQRDTLNLTKLRLNATNCLILEDPSLKLSIVTVASFAPRGGKMRDPGNEVEYIKENLGL